MTWTPLILGSGRSGLAIAKALATLNIIKPELQIEPAVWMKRGINLGTQREKYPRPLLCIANPHGLHAKAIVEGDRAGFDAILCEKQKGSI